MLALLNTYFFTWGSKTEENKFSRSSVPSATSNCEQYGNFSTDSEETTCKICFIKHGGSKGFLTYGISPLCQHWACAECLQKWMDSLRQQNRKRVYYSRM